MKLRRLSVVPTLLAVLLAGPALAQQVAKSVGTEPDATPAGDYRIGPEDVLLIAVWKNEAMSRTVPVRPDGMISLPLLNDVQAAGLTPMQLRPRSRSSSRSSGASRCRSSGKSPGRGASS